jgi:hypothetical protein
LRQLFGSNYELLLKFSYRGPSQSTKSNEAVDNEESEILNIRSETNNKNNELGVETKEMVKNGRPQIPILLRAQKADFILSSNV